MSLQWVLIKIFLKIRVLVLLIFVFPTVGGWQSQILFWGLSQDFLSLSQGLWSWAGAIPSIPAEAVGLEHWDGLCWIPRPQGRS